MQGPHSNSLLTNKSAPNAGGRPWSNSLVLELPRSKGLGFANLESHWQLLETSLYLLAPFQDEAWKQGCSGLAVVGDLSKARSLRGGFMVQGGSSMAASVPSAGQSQLLMPQLPWWQLWDLGVRVACEVLL